MDINLLEQSNKKTNVLVSVIRDFATLIGEEKGESTTLTNGQQIIAGLGMGEDAAILQGRLNDINQGLFTLLVLGEFKNGKSTLLNAILGGKILPARAVPTTAVITVVVYGTRDDVAIYRKNIKEPEYISWQEFVKTYRLQPADTRRIEAGETLDRFKDIKYAQIESQHPICANRVRLVDSPGLGEHISRTRLVSTFLKQSQAVIFVLNAVKLLSEDERDFIEEELGDERLENVFFVINRINQIDKDQVEDIKEWFHDTMADHFYDQHGAFDEEFYNRRVFFVNAKGALDARQANPVNNTKLNKSQVPSLEKELELFLTSEEKLKATYESTVSHLMRICDDALERIQLRKEALEQPVAQLKQQREIAELDLSLLGKKQADIGLFIIKTGKDIFYQLRNDLHEYLEEMKKNWDRESSDVLDLSDIQAEELVASLKSRTKAKKLRKKINAIVKQYLKIKLDNWSKMAETEEISRRINAVEKETQEDVIEFLAEIARIEREFATGRSQHRRLVRKSEMKADYLAKAAKIGGGNWSATIRNSLTGLAKVFTIFGTNAVRVYVWLYPVSKNLFGTIDEKTGTSFVEGHNAQQIAKFREELGKRIHKTLKEDFWDPTLLGSSIADLAKLARKLTAQQDPLSDYIWQALSSQTKELVIEFHKNPKQDESLVRECLVHDLNRLIKKNGCIYDAQRFAGIQLRDETKKQAQQADIGGEDLMRLNRWLLTEAHREEMAEKLQDTLYHHLMYEFNQIAEEITRPLRSYIDEVSANMEKIIADLESKKTAADKERQRLRAIEEELQALLHVVQQEFGQ